MSLPRIVHRQSAGALGDWPEHVHPVLRRVYAARGVLCVSAAEHRLAALLPPRELSGIARATDLLADAIAKQRRIIVAADFDCDGACGAAIAVRGLRMLGAASVGFVVPHRMRHGYGLTPALVDTLQPAPDLIVTVDNGIASIAGVAVAKARGCTVLITDHHLPGATLPAADAIVNPNLEGDGFASKCLCGAGVMFYLLLALRALLRDRGAFAHCEEPDLSNLLDLVSLATVADLVPLDGNNRILVESGLRRMRAGRACAGIEALIAIAGCNMTRLGSSDLGYSLAPRINAAGRLEDMTLGIECLLTDDTSRARELAAVLHGINGERRGLQDMMTADAEAMLAAIDGEGATGVSLFNPDWHAGVIGLVASKIKERLHRPVVAFAPVHEEEHGAVEKCAKIEKCGDGSPLFDCCDQEDRKKLSPLFDSRAQQVRKGFLRGSARSIPGFHIRDALAELDARMPGLIQRFGGHAMAAGLSLRADDFERFAEGFDAIARERIAPESLCAQIVSDGELSPTDFDLELARQLRAAGPWGQGFPPPLFDNVFECVGSRRVGADQRHLRANLRDPRDGRVHPAVWFNAANWPAGQAVRVAYELTIDDWQGAESLRLLVRHVEPEPVPALEPA
ncbi:MAG TPA: DHH family phosphoesterase [Rhodanobacteraceae bacterium]|nr:DHH family phosphoesterase [Rhodanobacteraceae bacterium]